MAVADTDWTEVTDALDQSERLLSCVLAGDADMVANGVDEVHRQNTSILRYNDENSLACVLSLAFYSARARYDIIRELPSGKGFADLVMIPHRNVDLPAIVLELKYDEDANTAIRQIRQNNYTDFLKDYSGNVVLVGISYDKKTKKHTCIIEHTVCG